MELIELQKYFLTEKHREGKRAFGMTSVFAATYVYEQNEVCEIGISNEVD